jgi:hypothetical protein
MRTFVWVALVAAATAGATAQTQSEPPLDVSVGY